MFFWLQLLGIADSSELIREKAVEKKFLMVPGQSFLPDNGSSSHVRASFSMATDAEMDAALERLASLLREEQAAAPKA